MRSLILQILCFLSLTLVSALNGDSQVVEVRQVKRQEDTGPGAESLASVPDATGSSETIMSSMSAMSGMSSMSTMSTMSPSPTTPISQDPTSTAQSASGDTAVVATGTEPESVSTSSESSSMVTDSSSTPTISQDPTSTAQSASGDTAIVATGAAPTATGRWAAAGLVAAGIGGLMI